jgi:hypothetical protein
MTYRLVCTVNNNQIVLTLPPDFKGKKKLVVVVDDQIDAVNQKLAQLKQAAKDPLFLSDINDIKNDFDSIDHETL